jgi:glutamine amidotransferase of anthranilate synthase or aminodeoxychorismate synthase
MLLMIDNYDSFTYNLVQYFGELGAEVTVVRNDQAHIEELVAMAPDHVVISPGPCDPDQAGVSLEAVHAFAGKIPVLGVCLGHQAIGQAFGGSIIRAPRIMHGKTSAIYHDGQGVFLGLEQPLVQTRYHSLVIDPDRVPDVLEVTAWSHDALDEPEAIMGVRHQTLTVEGVQFHPESIASHQGHDLLRNFLAVQGGHWT